MFICCYRKLHAEFTTLSQTTVVYARYYTNSSFEDEMVFWEYPPDNRVDCFKMIPGTKRMILETRKTTSSHETYMCVCVGAGGIVGGCCGIVFV